jgi:glucose uptake protein GlcU
MLRTANILFLLTLIQFWWIAIWGLAYIFIDAFAGTSKIKEIGIYIGMLFFTMILFHFNPDMVERL